ncbi:hypothetical protein BCR36DRAFT_335193 [Piromyces finnis]|uniref:Uncharacterized protein n=1 Tax=Piromyces finnis TaxID=1754191 RepID=A0A1Y1UZD9_9FUNG|nr:hypothetical protein BCR36DRAFT_335193 [Piromyces finnis]|eukprot:ORX44039.1 hypothetical protein BCR36DRAFT_335193 [Piromyces finnis]
MSSTEVLTINSELKRKPVGLLDGMNAKQIKLDMNKYTTSSSKSTTFENFIPNYTHLDNTQTEKLASSKFSEYISNHYTVSHTTPSINNVNTKTRFVTQPSAPVTVDYCETCNHVLQHCKGCIDHSKLCGNPHCGNRQKGTSFCVACKGLDEYHPICRNCVGYLPFSAQTNQCAHCKGYFCAASLSNPSLRHSCSTCKNMICWRCSTQCKPTTGDEEIKPELLNENPSDATKASLNIDILMK